MKYVLLICFCSMVILSACDSSAPTLSTTATPALADTVPVSITQTPKAFPTNPLTPGLDWFIYYRYVPEDNFWHVGQNWYQIISDCSDVNYLPSVEGRRVGFTVDTDQTLFQDGVVELEFNRIWLRYDGMTYLGTFNPKQQNEFIFGYDKLSFDQAREAANKCEVRVIVNDNLTLQLSPTGPTQEQDSGTYYAEP